MLSTIKEIKWRCDILHAQTPTYTNSQRICLLQIAPRLWKTDTQLLWDNVTLLQNHFDLEPSLTLELILVSMHCCFLWLVVVFLTFTQRVHSYSECESVICKDRFLGLSSILCRFESASSSLLYLRYIAVHPTTLNACSAFVRKELLIHSSQGRIWHFLYRSLRYESELQSAPPHPLPRHWGETEVIGITHALLVGPRGPRGRQDIYQNSQANDK